PVPPDQVVAVTDAAFQLEGELANGIFPYSFQSIAYQPEVYGTSGNPMHVGDPARPSGNVGDHHWDVYFHEMGHNFWNQIGNFSLVAIPGPFLQEATAVLTAEYVHQRIAQDPGRFGITPATFASLARISAAARSYQRGQHDQYVAAGANFNFDDVL